MALSYHAVVFRVNTGTVKTEDGRYFKTGVPKGFSDLCGYRKSDGRMFFIEVKTEKGRASKDQLHFLEQMNKYPVITGVVRSVDEALELIGEKGAE